MDEYDLAYILHNAYIYMSRIEMKILQYLIGENALVYFMCFPYMCFLDRKNYFITEQNFILIYNLNEIF